MTASTLPARHLLRKQSGKPLAQGIQKAMHRLTAAAQPESALSSLRPAIYSVSIAALIAGLWPNACSMRDFRSMLSFWWN